MNKMTIEDLERKPAKWIRARMYYQLILLNGTVRFHNRFIWLFIGILISSFIGGTIALLFCFVKGLIGA